MRKVEFLVDLEIIAVADGERRGAPLPYSVEGENRRLFERRGIEGRCRVRQMMLGEQEIRIVAVGRELAQLPGQPVLLEQLFPQPDRNGHAERLQAAWREREVSLEQPLELEERLVVEDDEIHFLERAFG